MSEFSFESRFSHAKEFEKPKKNKTLNHITSKLRSVFTSEKIEEKEEVEPLDVREKYLKQYPNACRIVLSEMARYDRFDSDRSIIHSEWSNADVTDISEVTLQYLEDWETADIGVNAPNLKAALLREILTRDYNFVKNIEKNEGLQYALAKMGMTTHDLLNDFQLFSEATAQKTHVFRATDQSVLISHILRDDERWKSQFETSTSNGSLHPDKRSSFEQRFFGFPDHNSAETKDVAEDDPYHVSKRPIYAYFTPDKNGILNEEGRHPPANATRQYGHIHCKLKKSKHPDVTLSIGDSLGSLYSTSPLIKPHYTSFLPPSLSSRYFESMLDYYKKMYDRTWRKKSKMKKITTKNLFFLSDATSSYTETQIHNGLSMSDIESIHISPRNYEKWQDTPRFDELIKAIEGYNERHPDTPVKIVMY